jgi:hypothetical protein
MGDDTFVTKDVFQEAVDRMIAETGEIGKKIDSEVASIRQEQGRLSTSINNVQTQVLEKKGAFSPDGSYASSSEHPAAVHKLRFPNYDGSEDPLGWLHKAEQFFRSQGTPEDQKVWTASFYMEGAAQQWYYRLEKNGNGAPTWDKFVAGVNKRFGPPVRSNPLGELTHLRRTGSMDEYQDQFLKLLARCDGLTEQQQIGIFNVEMQKPESFEDAMALARAYEQRLAIDDESSRAIVPARTLSRTAGHFTPQSSKTPPATSSSTGDAGCACQSPSPWRSIHAPDARGDGASSCGGAMLQLPREIHPRPP